MVPASQPMPKIQINGETIFTLPETQNTHQDSVLWFILPKAGTVMLSQIMAQLCREMGMRHIFMEGLFWSRGYMRKHIPQETARIFLEKGYCYGFATMPVEYEVPIIGQAKAIMHVRDIRDALVSSYYSYRDSHPEPGRLMEDKSQDPGAISQFNSLRQRLRDLELDEGVLYLGKTFRVRYARMMEFARTHEVLLTRYEDIIYKKAGWIRQICDWFGWDVSEDFIRELAAKHDVFPDAEKPDQHIRQVHPGNYLKKLKPETIHELESLYERELEFFGYEKTGA